MARKNRWRCLSCGMWHSVEDEQCVCGFHRPKRYTPEDN